MRWTNPSLPQTLQIAVIFLYISAFFAILNGLIAITNALGALTLVAGLIAVAAARGLVRERKVGYWTAVIITLIDVAAALLALTGGVSALRAINLLVALAVVGLLLHPMSRAYCRIWFR
jgi:uncharacterized membrane protein HdeD (DUF308 family)